MIAAAGAVAIARTLAGGRRERLYFVFRQLWPGAFDRASRASGAGAGLIADGGESGDPALQGGIVEAGDAVPDCLIKPIELGIVDEEGRPESLRSYLGSIMHTCTIQWVIL